MMNVLKEFVADYFMFSKRERRAVFILLILTGLTFLLLQFPFWDTRKEDQVKLFSNPIHTADLIVSNRNTEQVEENIPYEKYGYKKNKERNSTTPETTLFFFDPNTADEKMWQQLGVAPSVIKTLFKFRERGGNFMKPEDIRKIYGLKPEQCERLIPYVRIPEDKQIDRKGEREKGNDSKPVLIVDINKAGLDQWRALPGLGSGYAQRIFNFREKLGGFYTIQQVSQTYGLPDSLFLRIQSYLSCTSPPYNQISLNEADYDRLNNHPYIDSRTARQIIAFRQEHGPFQSITELQQIGSLNLELYEKIAPYLTIK